MSEPERNPDTGGRSLADILREAGIENPSRGRRRRWDDDDETGLRQRRVEAPGEEPPALPAYGRRASDAPVERTPERSADRLRDRGRDRGEDRGEDRLRVPPAGHRRAPREEAPAEDRRTPRVEIPAAGPSTAAIPGLRPSQKPSVPAATGTTPAAPRTAGAASAAPAASAPSSPGNRRHSGDRDRDGGTARSAAGALRAEPSTGPIPVVRPDDAEQTAAAPEGALAWLRFAGELVIAAAVGVGVYFAFTVLWEMLPHLAVVASPLVVTGLVTGVGAWRQRSNRGPMGLRLLALLVFAGTVLTILPAAGLLAGV